MVSEVLRKYIPSKTYVEYLDGIDHRFTDFETAAILYHVIEDHELKMEELSRLAERTEDAELKEQIERKVEYENRSLERFRDNSDGNAIYMVEYENEYGTATAIAGFASDYERAHMVGLMTKRRFHISKRTLYSGQGDPADRPGEKAYFNPYVEHDKDWDLYELTEKEISENYEVDAIGNNERIADYSYGELCFDSKGRLGRYYVDGPEGEDAKAIMEREFSGKEFYNAFIEFPYAFELGDYVLPIENGEDGCRSKDGCRRVIGIIDTERERYEEFLKRAGTMYVDAFDATVTVQFMHEDGSFIHDHVMPVFLEKVEPDKGAEWYDLVQHARWMIRGEGSLDFFVHAYNRCRRAYQERKEKRA